MWHKKFSSINILTTMKTMSHTKISIKEHLFIMFKTVERNNPNAHELNNE